MGKFMGKRENSGYNEIAGFSRQIGKTKENGCSLLPVGLYQRQCCSSVGLTVWLVNRHDLDKKHWHGNRLGDGTCDPIYRPGIRPQTQC